MKALTLTQPWATLVALGAKQIETRSWYTNYRGPLAIHAAKRFPGWAQELMEEEPFSKYLSLWKAKDLPRGEVIAVCTLTSVVSTDRLRPLFVSGGLSQEEYEFGDYSTGRYGWYLRDIIALTDPMPARGALGLWNCNHKAMRKLKEIV